MLIFNLPLGHILSVSAVCVSFQACLNGVLSGTQTVPVPSY